VLTVNSPILVGPRMDTSKLEKEQGAGNPADLILPPAVSSDEERLAAGVSTIGLQAKRPSGAQRRKLTKEKKIREGTWKAEKPPKKNPPLQDKCAEGSSGSVKRPHSDSSTPSMHKQHPKRPRSTETQTGIYKKAATGIKMAVIHRRHPETKLDQTQVDTVKIKLLNAVDRTPLGETPPQFLYSIFAQGILWITCANEHSKDWLMRTISEPGELWEGAELKVVDSKDLPKRPRVLVRIPDTSEVTAVMTRLRIQNPELNTTDWFIMSRKVTGREQTLALSIDPDSFKALSRLNFKAFLGLGRITFRILKEEKGKAQDEDDTSKSTSQ